MNLLGQNIGQNYRGILNLGTTINSPLSTTLQSVTDGMGNNSPLQLSTTEASITQSGINRLLIATDITMRRNDNTIFLNYSNAPDILELNGNTLRLNNLRGNTVIGTTAASARLHVRGDGINPIARFENNAGTLAFAINNNGGITIARDGNIGPQIYPFNLSEITTDILGFGLGFTSNKVNFASNNYDVFFNGQNYTTTSGVANYVTIRRTFAAAAGAASFRPLNLEYTINTTGAQTGTATGIFLNATETALNGMTHNLMDLQVGGVSRFRVSNGGIIVSSSNISTTAGSIYAANGYSIGWSGGSQFSSSTDGIINLLNSGFNNFNRLNFGGTTNLFPSIKRNGAAIDFRFADDSTFCNIRAGRLDLTGALLTGFINDATNAITAISIANTTGKTTFSAPLAATALPTTRPATVGDLYVDTAANILANGDKVVGIRV